MIKGQLLQAYLKNGWDYGVVLQVFDDRAEIRTQGGGTIMHLLEREDDSDQDIQIRILKQAGKIVMARRGLFGYKFKPRRRLF